jgi:hypothetical protein
MHEYFTADTENQPVVTVGHILGHIRQSQSELSYLLYIHNIPNKY